MLLLRLKKLCRHKATLLMTEQRLLKQVELLDKGLWEMIMTMKLGPNQESLS